MHLIHSYRFNPAATVATASQPAPSSAARGVFDQTSITDNAINSGDSGLTTNVFTPDPRVAAFNIMKELLNSPPGELRPLRQHRGAAGDFSIEIEARATIAGKPKVRGELRLGA